MRPDLSSWQLVGIYHALEENEREIEGFFCGVFWVGGGLKRRCDPTADLDTKVEPLGQGWPF